MACGEYNSFLKAYDAEKEYSLVHCKDYHMETDRRETFQRECFDKRFPIIYLFSIGFHMVVLPVVVIM